MIVKEEWQAGPIKITKIYQQTYENGVPKVLVFYTAQLNGMVSPWHASEQEAIEFITTNEGVKSA